MIKSTQIARLDGLMLCASIDDEATENALTEIKSHVKMVLRRLGRNSEPQASIESGAYTLHIVYIAICERSYPRKLAFTYLSDISSEFSSTYTHAQLTAPSLRPYAFMEFDTFIQRTKATYSDTRATQNLDKLNSELQDVTKVMTKNIEDLLPKQYEEGSCRRIRSIPSRRMSLTPGLQIAGGRPEPLTSSGLVPCPVFPKSLCVSVNGNMGMIITTVHKDQVLTVIGPWCIKADDTIRLMIHGLRDRGVKDQRSARSTHPKQRGRNSVLRHVANLEITASRRETAKLCICTVMENVSHIGYYCKVQLSQQ
ncbi:hypothetical protein V500_07060 [Pseudogymnoascus sp. VKM F-4518 (FW-2643)]|nr:hypothetical protein V500_07060 [Pseudogymnoascus sp. VKM F-4518 (FW-2643)]